MIRQAMYVARKIKIRHTHKHFVGKLVVINLLEDLSGDITETEPGMFKALLPLGCYQRCLYYYY